MTATGASVNTLQFVSKSSSPPHTTGPPHLRYHHLTLMPYCCTGPVYVHLTLVLHGESSCVKKIYNIDNSKDIYRAASVFFTKETH